MIIYLLFNILIHFLKSFVNFHFPFFHKIANSKNKYKTTTISTTTRSFLLIVNNINNNINIIITTTIITGNGQK